MQSVFFAFSARYGAFSPSAQFFQYDNSSCSHISMIFFLQKTTTIFNQPVVFYMQRELMHLHQLSLHP